MSCVSVVEASLALWSSSDGGTLGDIIALRLDLLSYKMFWHLLAGPVIGGQVYRIPPLATEEWGERKILVEERIGRVWPNAELSERAKCTREYVFRQFWQPFVDDKFDLENAIQTKA